MPKERQERSVSNDRSRASPFPCSSSRTTRSSSKYKAELLEKANETKKEWEDARCPVCMEHPHNAVLLIGASHEKGCRPYMCNTSRRHSNCLDQFKKSSTLDASSIDPQYEENSDSITVSPDMVTSEPTITDLPMETESCETTDTVPKLVCPLCRGEINGWIVEEPARRFMNAKSRNCSSETCDFNGSYRDLRKHARAEHPTERPCEANPERQRSWRRLERERDLGDLISTLQSTFGEEMGEEDSIIPFDDTRWLTFLVLIRVFHPGTSGRRSSSGWSRRARAQLSVRRRSTRLWGESYDGENVAASRGENLESSDGDSVQPRRRTRRQTTPDNQE